MFVVGISGKAGHGKDTLAKELTDLLQERGLKVQITHFADALKKEARELHGWNGEKDEAGRKLLQETGESRRQQDPFYWIKACGEGMDKEADFILIPDVRHPNEADWVKSLGAVIRVTRLDEEGNVFDNPFLTAEQKKHISEIALDTYTFNASALIGNGEEQVRIAAIGFMQHLLTLDKLRKGQHHGI